MTAQHEQLPSAPQESRERSAEFLYKVYDESKHMLYAEQKARTIAQIKSQFVSRWSQDTSDFNLVQGLILRNERYDYGLVLGIRGYSAAQEQKLTMEFGKLPHLDRSFEEALNHWSRNPEESKYRKETEYLDVIVHQPDTTRGSGRFYLQNGVVEISCPLDRRHFGGDAVGEFPYGERDSIVGLASYINVVRRVAEDSWR